MKQTSFFKSEDTSYGGDFLKTRKGRARPRPLDTKNSMHLVVRSTKARNEWSFWKPANKKRIADILHKFAKKNHVKVISSANGGNHLHLHIKLSNRRLYKPFIRAVTAAIAMAVTGKNRWNKNAAKNKEKFWDRRPFTRIVKGLRQFQIMNNYIKINQLEGIGYNRNQARFLAGWESAPNEPPPRTIDREIFEMLSEAPRLRLLPI